VVGLTSALIGERSLETNMYGYRTVVVGLNERVVVLDRGIPRRALPPGVHRAWGSKISEVRWNLDALTFEAPPEVRSVLPESWFAEVTLHADERAVLYKDARPVAFLRSGTHRYWTLDSSVELVRFDVNAPMPPLTDELLRVIPSWAFARALIESHERGLLFVAGELREVMTPGHYAYWSTTERPVRIEKLEVRAQLLTLAAQELMTRDKVTLRLTLSLEYAVYDPALAHASVECPRDALYLLVQLAAREFVAGVTLDALLEGRDAMTRALMADVEPKARDFGVRIMRAGLKDIVLPGEMKTLLNRVLEAEKEAAANVILRREEAAATRLLATTARTMAEEPMLMRLKELETMKEMAARVNELRLVVGSDALAKLLPQQLAER
jgi:regulator of protease activity HflC (stomatin/prohibitin superfamily)